MQGAMADIQEENLKHRAIDQMAARIEEDLASLYSAFMGRLLRAESGMASAVIEEYIGDRFDVRARWFLSAIQKESQLQPYLTILDWLREKDVEPLIEFFASSLLRRELVDARIVGRISHWKYEAMRHVREKGLRRGIISASPVAANLASSRPVPSEATPLAVEQDLSTEATSPRLEEAHPSASGYSETADQDSVSMESAKSNLMELVQKEGSGDRKTRRGKT
jgi:hypothetical protein